MLKWAYMQWAPTQKGFTIVELLIVVVVIAILAAITIVGYTGITSRANASAAANMASQAQKKLASYAVLNNDQYPATLAEAGIDGALAANLQYSVNSTSSPAGFCLTASENGVSAFVASNYQYTTSSTQTTTQASPGAGYCPGHSPTNGPTTTNLVLNPSSKVNATGWGALASTGGAQSGGRVTSVSGLSSFGVNTAYRNTLGGTPSSWWRVQNDSDTRVSEGQTYTLSGYIRTSVATSSGVIIIWENASGNNISESPGVFNAQTAGSWVRRSVTATAPAGAVTVRFHFGATNNGVAGAYLDAALAMFNSGATLYNFGDGDTTDWVWDGPASAATSRGPATQ